MIRFFRKKILIESDFYITFYIKFNYRFFKTKVLKLAKFMYNMFH